MAVVVDPFSFATAELSEEYISVFPHPDIVPKYLETVSDKTGVQLLTGCNTLSIKGPWVSLKRVHSFLTEFLASYQTAELDQDEKDIELLDHIHSPSLSCGENCNNEEDKSSPTPNNDARFHDSMGEFSDWIKWTAEVLPRIQRTRSKRASIYTEPKSQAKKVPEPLVLYASFQPTPDPDAKKPPTLDAIEKVLKKVYEKDKVLAPESLGESENVLHSEEINTAQSSDSQSKVSSEPLDQTSSGVSCQAQVQKNVLTDMKSDVCELQYNTEHFSRVCAADITDTTCVSLSTIQTEDTSTEMALPTKEPSPENPDNIHDNKIAISGTTEQNASSQSAGDIVRSSSAVQLTKGNSKFHGDKKQTEDSEPIDRKRSVAEADSDAQPLSADPEAEMCVSNQLSTVKRKTRRKGQPKRNEEYRKRKEEDQTYVPSSGRSSRCERARKQENSKMVKKVEESKNSPEKRKRGRPARPKAEAADIKEDEEEDFICDLCSYAAKKLSHLREHKRRVHITKEFKCDKCGKIFGFGKDLKRHRHTHKKAENCCDICGKMYKGVRTLAEHKKSHEKDYVKPEFPCEFCQKIFSTKYVLAYHIKSEHLGIKKTYLCPTCGKSFSQKNSYLQHANVHMGIRPYQCDTCGRSFSYEKSLKEHKYMHDDDKQFECHVCHKKFRQSSGVAIHMKIHKERKDYVCSACGKGFSQKQALIRHERIHVGEKPFACALCHRTFTDSSILRRHMILVHKKDPKKWREDTENNVKRRTDFFISVVGEKGEVKKSVAASGDEAVSGPTEHEKDSTLVQASGDGNGAHDSCATENVEDSFNFIPVSTGTASSPHPPVLPMVPPMSMTQCRHHGHADHSRQADPLCAVHKGETEKRDTTFALSLEPAVSSSKESAQPVDMSSQDPHSTQSSVLLNSYAYRDPRRLPSSDFFTGEMQQGAVSGLQLPQYMGVMAQGGGYPSATVVMSNTLNTLDFQTGTLSVTTASHQTVDCNSLVSQSSVQLQQYSHTQQ